MCRGHGKDHKEPIQNIEKWLGKQVRREIAGGCTSVTMVDQVVQHVIE